MSLSTDYDARVAIEDALAWLLDNGWEVGDLRDFCEEALLRIEEDDG